MASRKWPMLESKAMQGIKTLGGTDKMAYRVWNEKFINVISVIHPGARDVMEGIIKAVGEGMEFNEEFNLEMGSIEGIHGRGLGCELE